MNILKQTQKENNFIDIIVESRRDERFKKNEIYIIDNQKYKVFYSKRLNQDEQGFPIYDVSLQKVLKQTINDYSNIDFFHIFRIERKTETRIILQTPTGNSYEYNFNSPVDCLTDYISLRQMWGESYGTI